MSRGANVLGRIQGFRTTLLRVIPRGNMTNRSRLRRVGLLLVEGTKDGVPKDFPGREV